MSRKSRVRVLIAGAWQDQKAQGTQLLTRIRTENRKEWVENFLLTKLPYHPQFYRSRTRFDSVLKSSLDFGDATVASSSLSAVGGSPPPDSSTSIRFLSTSNSRYAHVGDPVEAVVSAPLLGPDHKLVMPEGTLLHGRVTMARPARFFRRSGRLRFVFNDARTPAVPGLEQTQPDLRTQAQMNGAETASGPLDVDNEGTAKVTESKTRFLRPLVASLVVAKSFDNDAGKATVDSNAGGRSLGGFSGFGLLGSAVRFAPRGVASAFAIYGLSWSAYSTIVARGRDVVFEKNSAMSIRFGSQPHAPEHR
jgi:hypothetical protein